MVERKGCIWMSEKLAEPAFDRGQITNFEPLDASDVDAIPTVVNFGYDHDEIEVGVANL